PHTIPFSFVLTHPLPAQVLAADTAVLTSDTEVEDFLLQHLRSIRQHATFEPLEFVTIIEQNYGGWVG
ncbi:MAG: hypothetical protein QMC37_12070, partial [Flavobacteriales bacterium]